MEDNIGLDVEGSVTQLLKKDIARIGKDTIRTWQALLIIGVLAGSVAGISAVIDWDDIFVGGKAGAVAEAMYDSAKLATTTVTGTYSGFYDFPRRFFRESEIPRKQIVKTTDAQYTALKEMHSGVSPYASTKIIYDVTAYGHTTADGIALGDSAFPGLNDRHPLWEVIAHENGHNFFGGTSAFYGTLAFGHPFLQESLAVMSAFYTYYAILADPSEFGIDAQTVASLTYDFGNGRNYQEAQYKLYVSRGASFDIDDVLTSQALDYKMILYGETYGWNKYIKFSKAFEDGIAPQFTFQDDGVSATEQSTYVVAALHAAFGKDFRKEFAALNFPVDKALYREIYPKINEYIKSASNR